MLAGIITGYFAIGAVATGAMEISARVGKNEDDRKLCEMIDNQPFISRTRLIVGWPDWVIGGIVNGIKNRTNYSKEDK